MKQIRVKSPFLDSTASNIRREVGDIFLAEEKRAAYLVNGELCEYVEDEEKKEVQKPEQANGNGETVAPAEGEQKPADDGQPKTEGDAAKVEVPTEGEQPKTEGKATKAKGDKK